MIFIKPLIVLSVLLFSVGAVAHPFELYSASPRISALGGAGTAASNDGYAAYFNPASLSTSRGAKFTLGFTGASNYFKWGTEELNEDADLPFYGAFESSLLYPIPLRGALEKRLALGVLVSLPVKHLVNVTKQDSNDIIFPFYNDRVHRIVAAAGLSARIFDWLAVGGGLSLLPKVDADVDVNLSLEKENIYNAAGIEVGYSLSPVAGILAMPIEWMKIGLSYRRGQRVAIDLPIIVEDPPARTRVYIPAFVTPDEVSLGTVFVAPLALTFVADATYSVYSDYEGAFPHISLLGGETEKVINEASPDDKGYRNIITPRLGVEWSYVFPIVFRLGGSYRPTPVGEQTGNDNVMDGDAFIISGGLGLFVGGTREYFPADFKIDAGGRLIIMRETLSEKERFIPDNPGFPRVRAGGEAVSFGASVTVEY